MKRIPKAIYKSVADLEAHIEALEIEAVRLPPDAEQHRQIMQEIARLRVYADMERWLTPPSLKSVH
jgi:hypothetical protein